MIGRPGATARAGVLAARFGPALLIVALAVVAYASGLLRHVTLDELADRRQALQVLVQARPAASFAAFIALYTGAVILSLPLVLVLTVAGGFLFGIVEGGLGAAAASTLGGMVTFLASRTAAGDILRRWAGPRVRRLQDEAQRGAFSLMLGLRLIPMMPFWVLNVGAAVLEVPFKAFALSTAIGVLPSCLIYASLGAGLGGLFDAGRRPTLALMMRPQVLLPLGALVILALAPLGYRMVRARRTGLG